MARPHLELGQVAERVGHRALVLGLGPLEEREQDHPRLVDPVRVLEVGGEAGQRSLGEPGRHGLLLEGRGRAGTAPRRSPRPIRKSVDAASTIADASSRGSGSGIEDSSASASSLWVALACRSLSSTPAIVVWSSASSSGGSPGSSRAKPSRTSVAPSSDVPVSHSTRASRQRARAVVSRSAAPARTRSSVATAAELSPVRKSRSPSRRSLAHCWRSSSAVWSTASRARSTAESFAPRSAAWVAASWSVVATSWSPAAADRAR